MKKVIGIIFSGPKLGEDEILFRRIAKKNKIKLVLLDTSKGAVKEDIEKKIKNCDIIYNNSAADAAVEFEKTIEELGKKVIDPTKYYYYIEDKWMFYLKCVKNKIPTPETILLSDKIDVAKQEVRNFNHWPVVLKRVEGTCGEYVDKAETLKDMERIVKKFWKKGTQRMPVIAQEFVDSPCYRITIIDKKITQAVVKRNRDWKKTGVYAKRVKRFKVNKELNRIINKIRRIMKIEVSGLDFLKKDGKWIALEINSAPAFDFFESEREKIVAKVFGFLVREASKKN